MVKPITSTAENPYRRSLLRRQGSVDTRANIVRAAARLWAEQGFDGPTIEDICGAAGVGRSTFYFHFESKDQLIDELTWATAVATAHDLEAALGDGGLDEQIDTFINSVAGRMTKVPRAFVTQVLRRAAARNVPDETPDDRVDFARILTPVFNRAQADGELGPKVDPEELAEILSSMTMEAILRWAKGRTRPNALRDSIALRFELVLDGLRTVRSESSVSPDPTTRGASRLTDARSTGRGGTGAGGGGGPVSGVFSLRLAEYGG